jgi:hypothetical protein
VASRHPPFPASHAALCTCPPCSHLAVRTPAGKRVLVHVSSEQQLDGIHTGMHIEVSGRWQQATTGGGRRRLAGAGNPAFQAVSIRASGAAYAAPKLTIIGGSGAAAGAAAAGAGPTAGSGAVPPITLSTNTIVSSAVNTIVIPSELPAACMPRPMEHQKHLAGITECGCMPRARST